MRTVARISVPPVRGFQFEHPEEVELTERGVVENRRFFMVDGEGNRLRSSLTAVSATVDRPGRVRVGDTVAVVD
jgi:uncharacterized protein YcbX